MVNSARRSILFVAALLAAASVGYFVSSRPHGSGRVVMAQAANSIATVGDLFGHSAEGLPSPGVEPDRSNYRAVIAERSGHVRGAIKRSAVLDEPTKDTILSCVKKVSSLQGVKSSADFNTLTEYFAKAVVLAPGHVMQGRLQYRNMRLLDETGRRLRLYVSPAATPDDGPGAGQLTMVPRLFATDDDNLAVPLELPEELKSPDWPAAIERMKSKGQLVSDEISEDRRWDDKTSAHLILHNGRIENLEIFFAGGELNCARTDDRASAICQCL